MPATESVNLFSSLASTSAILMADIMNGMWFYIGLGLTILFCGAILSVVIYFIKGRKKRIKIKYRKIHYT